MLQENKIIQGLWVGPKLSPMEQLSIRSFLFHGHDFHLYVYGPLEGVPEGTVLKDANQILSKDEFDPIRFSSLGAFSDFFRHKLLLEKGGWWVDTDTVCLKPFDFDAPYVFSSEELQNASKTQHTNSGNIKVPAGSDIEQYIWNECLRTNPSKIPWGAVGPALVKRAVERFGLQKYVQPPNVFCPIPYWLAKEFQNPSARLSIPETAYAIHLWNEVWNYHHLDKTSFIPNGLYDRLNRKYSPSKKPLIAIVSCKLHEDRVKAIKETWLNLLDRDKYDVEFFDGDRLRVLDDYKSLPHKTQAIFRWALQNKYEHVLKIDDDTYIIPKNLKSNTDDYAGTIHAPTLSSPFRYCSGGAYWVSEKSMRAIVDARVDDWAEDRWVGKVLVGAGIYPKRIDDFVVLFEFLDDRFTTYTTKDFKDIYDTHYLCDLPKDAVLFMQAGASPSLGSHVTRKLHDLITNGNHHSDLRDITIAVTSFLRPGYLFECLALLQKYMPDCHIIVADDSYEHPPVPKGVELIPLPFDSGLSKKRNVMVEACKTKYILMYHDDFKMDHLSSLGILKLLNVLDLNPNIDVAGGRYRGHPYEGFLRLVPGEYIEETRLEVDGSAPFYKVDLVVNYFLARVDSIKSIPWDERMKIGGEHGDWFLEMKNADKTTVWVPGVNIEQLPDDRTKVHPEYNKFRERAVGLGHRIFLEKRGVKSYKGFPPIMAKSSTPSPIIAKPAISSPKVVPEPATKPAFGAVYRNPIHRGTGRTRGKIVEDLPRTRRY